MRGYTFRRWKPTREAVGMRKLTYEYVKVEFEKRGYKLLSDTYVNGTTKLKYECPQHKGIVNEIAFQNFKHSKQGCPHCAGNQKYTIEQAREMFNKAGYELLEENYINKDTPMRFKCPFHPKENTYKTLSSIRDGHECEFCYYDKSKGINHPRYNPEINNRVREDRRMIPGYIEWRTSVFERDNYTCVKCGDGQGGNLYSHHKDGFNWCEGRRLDVSNGVTLCNKCHNDFHRTYGYGENTEIQYNEWISEG